MAISLRSIGKALTVGLVLLFAHAYLFTQAPALFGSASVDYQIRIGVYAVFMALVFGLDSTASRRTESPLFTASFFSAQGIVKAIIFAGITLAILIPFGMFVSPKSLPTISQAISGVGLGVMAFHAFIVAFDEELIFRGRLSAELRNSRLRESAIIWIQAVTFALFHYGISQGSPILMAVYIPLGAIFYTVQRKYSPKTNMANIGVHFAWNLFVLGFVQAVF